MNIITKKEINFIPKESFDIFQNSSNFVTSYAIINALETCIKCKKEIGMEEVRENEKEDVLDFGVSFSTTLTAEEERVRKIVNETELPYLKRRTKDNVEHKIEIDSEDEDDPDDDLDI